MYQVKNGTVYIIGAGPGAPDLLAVRAREIIEQADLVLYADSLVEHSVADLVLKPSAEIVPSSGLHLEQMIEMMVAAAKQGKVVARVHSGDPSLYGATHEQMARLDDAAVPYVIVPGITAAFAAAAQLGVELTIPDVVQTIILTRTAGRTSMPEGEELLALAAPGASLAIYLSITRIKKVVAELIASGGYAAETPIAVFHKVTWPDESYVTGTLADIADKVRAAGYTKHALILVSPALDPSLKAENRRTSSHLYDKSYTHRFRKAEKLAREKERREAALKSAETGQTVVFGEKHLAAQRTGTVVLGLTKRGSVLAATIGRACSFDSAVPEKFAADGEQSFNESVLVEIGRRWRNTAQFVLVMPVGVATRAIAPLLRDKTTDPAVICVDEAGKWAIPLVGGHLAGANTLAAQVAAVIDGTAVVTTASDGQNKPALDLLVRDAGWMVANRDALTHVMACLVNDETVGVYMAQASDALAGVLALEAVETVAAIDELDIDSWVGGIIVTDAVIADQHQHLLNKCVVLRPKTLVVGMGCKRGVPVADLRAALEAAMADAQLSLDSVRAIATVDLKADEAGLKALAAALDVPLEIVASEQLQPGDNVIDTPLSPSAATEKFGLIGVAEPCALLVSGGDLVVAKRGFEVCTVAVAREE